MCFILANPHLKSSGRIWCAEYLCNVNHYTCHPTRSFLDISYPLIRANGYRIWIMISFYSLTAVKKLGTLRVIGLCTSIAFVLVSLSLLSSPSPSDPRKTNHNSCYCLALRACVSPHSVRTARLREDSLRVFHRPPGYRFRYFATLDGISRPPFCITTDLFAE